MSLDMSALFPSGAGGDTPAKLFGCRPMLDTGRPDRFRSLFCWEHLGALVAGHPFGRNDTARRLSTGERADQTTIGLSENDRPIPRSEWVHSDGRIDAVRLQHLLRRGATLAVRRVDHHCAEVADLARRLEAELRAPINCVAYAAFHTTPALGLHMDPEDTLILQIEGTKRWRVHPPTRTDAFPLGQDVPAPLPTSAPIIDVELEVGDVLHIPRGWWHQVEPVGRPSLHLACTVVPRAGVDLFDWLVSRPDGERGRAPIGDLIDRLATAEAATELGAALRLQIGSESERFLDDADRDIDRIRPRLRFPGGGS